jgi:hypothetical protein
MAAERGKPKHRAGDPVVSTLERAAHLFRLELDQLVDAVAAAGLAPWGRHASGAAVYRWPELVGVAQDLGATVATRSKKGPVPLTVRAARGRASRYQGSQP